MGLDPALHEQATAWCAADPDPATRDAITQLIAAGDEVALGELFSGRLSFGTAGLRAAMGPGPRRMNRLVVRQSAAGIARYLTAHTPDAGRSGVLVAHDARHHSATFADDCAEVIAAHGIPVHRIVGHAPTPLAVFASAECGCAAGLVVTASHNPATDNGIKLYGPDAAQIVSPVDGLVAAAIDAVVADGQIVRSNIAPAPIHEVADGLRGRYLAACLARLPGPQAPIKITTTAMHGVGGALLAELLRRGGHGDVQSVASQQEPDPDFPSVDFPNPEEPGVTAALSDLMTEAGADLGLALDPDSDRVAVLVPADGGPRQLTGDEVGALLGDWLLSEVEPEGARLVAASVVSSTLLSKIARGHDVSYFETLTGFKWLSRPALDHPELRQVFAYEEAIGYAIGHEVRDKDGISAALAVATMASHHAAHGRSLLDALDQIHRLHGVHLTANFSIRDDAPGGAERRDAAVAELKAHPPSSLAGSPVIAVDLPADDVVRIDLGTGLRAVVRPSGTEPKLKCYCEAVEGVGADGLGAARRRAAARLDALGDDLRSLVNPG